MYKILVVHKHTNSNVSIKCFLLLQVAGLTSHQKILKDYNPSEPLHTGV